MIKTMEDCFAPPSSKEVVWAKGRAEDPVSMDDLLAEIDAPESEAGITSVVEVPESVHCPDSAASSDYRFPDYSLLKERLVSYEGKTSKDILIAIGQLSHERRDEAGSRCSYLDVREELCALNILLNERGSYAPRVRGMRVPVNPRSLGSSAAYPDLFLSNDRQVIDLHWIHARGILVIDVPGYQRMLDRELPFDWIRVANFVSRVGGVEKKAELLGLSEYDQLQLAALQTKAVSDRWRTIRDGMLKHQGKMITCATRPRSRMARDEINELPDIYLALRVARGSPGEAASAFRWLAGREISRKRMSVRLQWFKELRLIIKE